LTRKVSTHTFPSSVKVRPVDYSSLESLVSVLRGQDAVVSTMATLALDRQLLLIDAAAAAGVRRFIPSEFGSDSSNPKSAALPAYTNKLAAQKALRDKAAAGTGFSYTIICTGPFLDWGITKAFMSVKDKRISLFDGGDRLFSTTTLPTIGKAVCAVLAHPEETENRIVRVQDTTTTLKKLLEMGKKATGSEGWKVDVVPIDAMLENAWAEFRQGKRDLKTMHGFIPAANWGNGYGGYFEKTDNELLGIKEMTDAELQALVDKLAK
jgi:NmrA-like family